MGVEIDRRTLLSGAGAAFLASLQPARAAQLKSASSLFVSAFMDNERQYGFAILDDKGALIHRHTMPARAHGFAWSPQLGQAIAFARRPGNFAIAFDPAGGREPVVFHSPEGRHFYGHGVFSADGRLLFATENDFEAGQGKIGIYDAAASYRRIGEFDSYGVGPHEMILTGDGRTLAIANGGIRTHPDFGRQKLNLAEMESSIVLIDSRTGDLRARHVLAAEHRRMSLRHMVHAADGALWIGGQFEGDPASAPSPVYRMREDGETQTIELPVRARRLLSGYVGAVAIAGDGRLAGFSSPRGGGVVVLDTETGDVHSMQESRRTSGLYGAARRTGGGAFVSSNEDGRFGESQYPLHWDNHLIRCDIS